MRTHLSAFLVSATLAAGIAACGNDASNPLLATPPPGPQGTVATASGNIAADVNFVFGEPKHALASLNPCVVCVYGPIGAIAIPNF